MSGPILGGNLARPGNRWPSVFRVESIWARYPFLLPNIVVAALLATTAILAIIVLPETHSGLSRDRVCSSSTNSGVSYILARLRGQHTEYTNLNQETESEDVGSPARAEDTIELQPLEKVERPSTEVERYAPPSDEISEYTGKTFTRNVVQQILSVSLLAFHKVSMDVLLPVFLATPASGDWKRRGFGLSTAEIGYLLTSQAIVMTAAQWFLVPKVIKRFGALPLYRWILAAFPLLYMLVPLSAIFSKPINLCTILPLLWCSVILTSTGYTCCSIL